MSSHKRLHPRLVVEITTYQQNQLNQLIPWGVRSQLFRIIINDLIQALKKDPEKVLGLLLSRSANISDFPSLKGMVSDGNNK